MCTVILLRQPGGAWPVILAANRDEQLGRAWDPPAPWWPGQPNVVGGQDREAGGTWMAASGNGVVAAVLNRPGSLGRASGKRSRGELPLLALRHPSAAAAAAAIAALPAGEWRPFNLVVADRRDAIFLRGLGHGRAVALALPEGVSMVTAHDPNDPASPRTARHLPRFRAAPPPNPEDASWTTWESLLADAGGTRAEALTVPPVDGFGTVCASLLALGAAGQVVWRFAPGRAGMVKFAPVSVPGDPASTTPASKRGPDRPSA